MSKKGTEIAGHMETAAQPGIAEARGELDATAAKDEEEKTRVGCRARPPMLLQLVPSISDFRRDRRFRFRASGLAGRPGDG